jgi:hypothetical protein
MSGTHRGPDIEVSMRVLDILNEANDSKPISLRVDYKEFYNDAINKEINLRDHQDFWITEREKARKAKVKFDRFKFFSICCFPWILSPANKADLMIR